MFIAVVIVAAFLIGGIPFGYLAGRIVLKDDIRNHGSGNIGATNVTRVLGWKWGSLVLVLDALKGLLPVLGAQWYAQKYLDAHLVNHVTVAAGLATILGHMFPIYLKLRGGKGVATALGVVLVLSPISSGIAFGVFTVTFAITRIVGLGSIVASLTFAIAYFTINGKAAFDTSQLSLTAFAVLIPALIIFRHRSNIKRLISGQEKPIA